MRAVTLTVLFALTAILAFAECGTNLRSEPGEGGTVAVQPDGTLALLTHGSHGSGTFKSSKDAATGTFTKGAYKKTGWSVLSVKTNPAVDDRTAMRAAGYLEGSLTHHDIWQYYQDEYWEFFSQTSPPLVVVDFIKLHLDWLRLQVDRIVGDATHADHLHLRNSADVGENKAYWFEVALLLEQFDGLVKGYNHAAPKGKALSDVQMMVLNLDGDLEAIIPAVNNTARLQSKKHGDFRETDEWEKLMKFRCSGLVRVTPGNKDLFMAHSTWDSYGSMLRIYKHYDFPLKTSHRRVSFSSSPGFLSSVDDFYMTANGLTVIETTNGLYVNSLFDEIHATGTIMSWMRAMIANYVAKSGPEWSTMFSAYNSGTYNNQWFVIDTNQFTPGEPLKDGLLTVLEQMPNLIVSADQTDFVREHGYWASYNVPFYPAIYNQTGFLEKYTKHGNQWSWAHCPRGNIFRRDAPNVLDMDSMKHIMRYNDWKNDPLSLGSPANAVMSRYDLLSGSPQSAFGGIDTKVTSYTRSRSLTAEVCNGPTSDQQPVFKWSDLPHELQYLVPHQGQPNVFDWGFVTMTPAS